MNYKQPSSDPLTPFDAYFKGVFTITYMARLLLQYALPSKELKNLNLSTLRLAPDSFVDRKLKKSISDLIYICDIVGSSQKKARICILLEHKSTHPGRLIYPQIGRYLFSIQDEDIKQKRKNFSLTIPIVFYHGKEVWNPKSMVSMYGSIPAEFVHYIPAFNLVLVNLQEKSREDLLTMDQFSLLRNVFLTMKRDWDDDFFLEHFENILIFADENVESELLDLLFDMTWAVIERLTTVKKNSIMKIAAALPPTQEARFLSFYEQTINEGIEKGIERGIEKGIERGIEKGIERGIEKGIERGIEKGIERGIEKGIERTIINVIHRHPALDNEQIADLLGVDIELVKHLREQL